MKKILLSFLFFLPLYGFVKDPVPKNGFISTEKSAKEFPEVNLKDIKNIPDLYFECRIAEMADSFSIPMFYDSTVREYLEIYLLGRSNHIPELSGLSEIYFPLFEFQLRLSGTPSELKYLPVIESALDPEALSPTGAYGLWQFKPATGRAFGLVVNDTCDERNDPLKSTLAACSYLQWLYKEFGNWQLCLLAYHAGPTTVRNAIIKAAGRTDFQSLSPYLPVSTRRYLPSFFAVIYVMNLYKVHI